MRMQQRGRGIWLKQPLKSGAANMYALALPDERSWKQQSIAASALRNLDVLLPALKSA